MESPERGEDSRASGPPLTVALNHLRLTPPDTDLEMGL